MATYSTELDPFIAALKAALDADGGSYDEANFASEAEYVKAFTEKAVSELIAAIGDNAAEAIFTPDRARAAIEQNSERIVQIAREDNAAGYGKAQSSETDILTYSLPEETGPATIDDGAHTVDIEVANGTDVTALTPTFTVSPRASASPASGVEDNYTAPVVITVTAQDGTEQEWTVTVTEAA